ncbi:hypothetical protein ACTMTI_01815 [Nonomuraea sp. H19]|uniref:hypothetical protein n=1 Tax=Nonomuraea sp. H19 TaxID=3452206 RepID=UPI003F8AE718
MTDDFPEMPDFDPKLARRAVRRGLLRTTSNVLAVLLALALVATVGSTLLQTRGDRERRMTDVLGTAFKIYNPGYSVDVDHCCETTPLGMSFDVRASPLRAVGGFWPVGGERYSVSQNLFGRVGRLPLGSTANTKLSLSLYDVGTTLAPKEEVRKVLKRLPEDLRALVVVEFATPLAEADMKAFAERYKSCPEKIAYERRPGALSITWSPAYWSDGQKGVEQEGCVGDLRSFRAWVGMLRDHDGANLRAFDLSLARLRKAANEGLAYAYVDQVTTIKALREIIEDPRVRTVRLADVTFDLDRP